MNINDELLILASEYVDSFKDATSIASMALFEIYALPFFNNQYQKYQLQDINGFVRMSVGNYTQDGIKYNIKNNEFNFHIEKAIKEKLNHKEPEYDDYIDDDDYPLHRKILSSENLALIERTKEILKSDNFDNFLKSIEKEIERDPKYLLKLYSIFKNDDLFKMLKEFLVLNRESNNDYNLGINLCFKEKEKTKKGFNFDSLGSYFYRDTLNDWFLFLSRRFEKTGRVILKELMEDPDDFDRFLMKAGVLDNYKKEIYSKKDIETIVKELLKNKNEYAVTIFKVEPDKRKYRLIEAKYKDKVRKIREDLNSLNISELSIEQHIDKNREIVDKIKSVILEKYPYLNSGEIPKDEITVFMGCAKLPDWGSGSGVEVLGEEEIFNYFPSLRGVDDVKFYTDKELDGSYERKSRFEDAMFQSDFSIHSDFVSFSDGFGLFNNNHFNYCQGKTGFYLDFKYKNQVIAKASIFESGEGRGLFIKMGSVEVAKPYRGQGLSYVIYNKLADICSQNNKIIISSFYTEDGDKKLPKVKEKIQSQRDDVLFAHEYVGFSHFKNKPEVFYYLLVHCEIKDYQKALRLKEVVDLNWNNWSRSKNENACWKEIIDCVEKETREKKSLKFK